MSARSRECWGGEVTEGVCPPWGSNSPRAPCGGFRASFPQPGGGTGCRDAAGGRGSRPRGRSLLSAPQCKGPSSGPDFKNKVPFSPESFTQCILD